MESRKTFGELQQGDSVFQAYVYTEHTAVIERYVRKIEHFKKKVHFTITSKRHQPQGLSVCVLSKERRDKHRRSQDRPFRVLWCVCVHIGQHAPIHDKGRGSFVAHRTM